MSHPVIILGAGGHARVLIDALRLLAIELLGVTDVAPGEAGRLLLGIPILGGDEEIAHHSAQTIRLVNGLGSVNFDLRRSQLFQRFKDNGYQFFSIIHPTAVVAPDVVLSEGVQIMAGAVIQTGSHIGKNTIINTRVAVDHDCSIEDHAHISPGATLSGGVRVGQNTHIGTGASIIQGIKIGYNCVVAAGAVVIRDVPNNTVVAGVPAKEVK